MSLQTRLSDVISAIGVDIKSILNRIDTLENASSIFKELTTTQSNSTVTPTAITELITTLEANSIYKVTAFVTFRSAATTTGVGIGYTSLTDTLNQIEIVVPISSGAVATHLRKIFPNGSELITGEVLGTGVTTINANQTAMITGLIHTAGVVGDWTPRFRSEVAGSAITLQVGSSILFEKVG